MSQVLKIYALFLGSAILMFGGGLQGLLLAVRGAEESFSLIALGLIGTGWSIGFVAGSITVPVLVRRVGHIRAYAVMAAVGAFTILLNLLWINDIGWIVLRIFSGFCFAGAAMIVESWLNEVTENKRRGTVFSLYVTINMAASTLGQLAMSITGVQGHLPFVIGAMAFILALMPTALTSNPQPKPLKSAKLDLGLLYRTSPIAVIASFSVGIANGSFGALAPVLGFQKGLDPANIALLMSLTIILGAVAQVPFGRLSDSIDRRVVLVIVSFLASLAGLAIVTLDPTEGWLLFALFGAYGFLALPIYAVAVAHANDFARDGDFSTVASGMLVVLGLGLAIGPIMSSLAMNLVGPSGLFIITAAFHGSLAISAFIRMRMRAPVNAEDRAPFRSMPTDRNPVGGGIQLDPRVDESNQNDKS